MPDKLGTKDIAGVVPLLLGIGIAASQVSVIAVNLASVVTEFGLVTGGPAEGVMKMFGVT